MNFKMKADLSQASESSLSFKFSGANRLDRLNDSEEKCEDDEECCEEDQEAEDMDEEEMEEYPENWSQ
jgi:hypothetical protein